MFCTRRSVLGAIVTSGVALDAPWANASLARGLTLRALASASALGVVATPLQAHCEWATFGRSRMIVTDTRVRIEAGVHGKPRESAELIVRVLGGRIGELGERVDGQAALVLGKPCVLFLTEPRDATAFVTGAAQGHYPLRIADRDLPRLTPSPHLPRLLEPREAAVTLLRGRTVAEARELVRAATR